MLHYTKSTAKRVEDIVNHVTKNIRLNYFTTWLNYYNQILKEFHMACMIHICNDCEHDWFDNIPRGSCPECGSSDVIHIFDEAPDDEEEPGYDEDVDADEDEDEGEGIHNFFRSD